MTTGHPLRGPSHVLQSGEDVRALLQGEMTAETRRMTQYVADTRHGSLVREQNLLYSLNLWIPFASIFNSQLYRMGRVREIEIHLRIGRLHNIAGSRFIVSITSTEPYDFASDRVNVSIRCSINACNGFSCSSIRPSVLGNVSHSQNSIGDPGRTAHGQNG